MRHTVWSYLKALASFSALTVGLTSGESARSQEPASSLGGVRSEVPAYRSFDANLYIQTSAEYRAACYQAFQLASLRLKQALESPRQDARTPAVILDLDETVLDNRGFQNWMLQGSVAFDQAWFDRWEQSGGDRVTLVPGAKEFILQAKQLGVKVVFISNRNERFREYTKATLQRLGIGIVYESELKLSTTTSDKTARRSEVTQHDNCQVLLNIGDNLRDFDEAFRFSTLPASATVEERLKAIADRQKKVDDAQASFGTQWIILPNPAYGEWTKPLGRGMQDLDLIKSAGSRSGLHSGTSKTCSILKTIPKSKAMKNSHPADRTVGPRNDWTSNSISSRRR